jgi:hypothetical protein
MKKVIYHGEVAFFEVDEVPANAKKLEVKESFYVVGESETLHNDHRVDVLEGTDLFTEEDKVFLKTIGTEIYCPNRTRHATIELPAGTWQIGHAQEYDYFAETLRRVTD